MIQKTLGRPLPPEVGKQLVKLGENIRIARKRRGLSSEDMASRMFVTRKTLSRLENGEPGVTMAVLASALWVLGLDRDLNGLANPESDAVGLFREKNRLPKRVRKRTPPDELDF